jgi:hypothetical protein
MVSHNHVGFVLMTSIAYIMWALAEAGVSGIQLEKELAHLNKLAEQGNSYVMALAALANHRLRNHGQAKMLADKLTSMQDMPEGSLKQPGSTIVHSVSRYFRVTLVLTRVPGQ